MKSFFRIFLLIATLCLSSSNILMAEEIQTPPDNSSTELQRIKSLAGRWTSTTSMFGKKDEQVFTEYEVTAGGSAVLERIFPGTPHEMVSMYYDEDGKLTMTHYCIMRNRPTMKLVSHQDNKIKLRLTKLSGAKSKKEPSMSEMDITFKDNDHIAISCGGQEKGKEASEPMT
ncbi:MAG: hypothetical protein JNK65_01535, partial [Deltaproteobacteria bacterium]|nr:hypothetical protein [Deltaproteobacteria bacterium]